MAVHLSKMAVTMIGNTLQAAYFSLAFSLLLLKFMTMSWKTLLPSPKSLSRYGAFVFTVLDCPIANGGKM